MNRKAIIFGIKRYKLTSKEKLLFRKTKPWGIILFSRNVNNILQLKNLVKEIKKIFKDEKFPILIDEEGGTVSRLNKIIDLSFFSQNFFGKLYNQDKNLFYKVYKIYVNKVSDILNKVGININTVPVLDVLNNNNNNFIRSRSYSKNTKVVTKLGVTCINFYNINKIATVIKHIPGHGMTNVDSHYKTPSTQINQRNLLIKNFAPFKNSQSLFAMTAHVIYEKYDPKYTATHSKIIVDKIIRKHINFKGILISDDISMKSLKYPLLENATRALKAGCNIVLHCNGNIKEMIELSKVIPKIDKFTKKKTSHFYKFLG